MAESAILARSRPTARTLHLSAQTYISALYYQFACLMANQRPWSNRVTYDCPMPGALQPQNCSDTCCKEQGYRSKSS
jgi:hypothetical protein